MSEKLIDELNETWEEKLKRTEQIRKERSVMSFDYDVFHYRLLTGISVSFFFYIDLNRDLRTNFDVLTRLCEFYVLHQRRSIWLN
jgi:hypothetical protein